MPYLSLNPATGLVFRSYDNHDSRQIAEIVESAARAQLDWAERDCTSRAQVLARAADLLAEQRDTLAALITGEMGKLLRESLDEIDKCAALLRWVAAQAPAALADEQVAEGCVVRKAPLGIVLGIMPWNYPFSQVLRYAASALVLGNGCLLKHATNVPQCALAIERLWLDAGLPPGLFRTLLIEPDEVATLIARPEVQAVALTGSEAAGRAVAAVAGKYLKKTVLELGGSDPFVVLHDADLDHVLDRALPARFTNCGQSCLSAKRFIVVPEIADAFVAGLAERIGRLLPGDPLDPQATLAPMARDDLRLRVRRQVADSVDAGAQLVLGGQMLGRAGFFLAPTLLDHVPPASPAYADEVFGPVAAVIRAADEHDALRIANDNRFGLGGSVWSRDVERATRMACRLKAGYVSVNQPCRSDPRLPLGGVKASGYGREMGLASLHEFANLQSLRIGR